MALTDYNRKRIFKKTPEPRGVKKMSSARLRFVVQKHAASRLHYDFRLELDGVLKSWAVPKGPSLDPSVKRLAMMVEDHPISYIRFSGHIPAGNYGAGTVEIWDQGVYSSVLTADAAASQRELKRGLKQGSIKFVLYGKKLKGGFALVKIKDKAGKKDNSWLLIKEKDEYASGKSARPPAAKAADPFPSAVKPMLATRVAEPFSRPGWVFETKWDGYRALAEIKKGKSKLISRSGRDMSRKYEEITEALGVLSGHTALLDGEIIALKDGRPSFHSLQQYEVKPVPLQYAVFDLLYLDGEDLRDRPLKVRKEQLKSFLPPGGRIFFSEHVEAEGEKFFKKIKKEKSEGMIAKDAGSSYETGRRSRDWLKVKSEEEQEAVIIGYTKPRGSRKHLGALVLGAYRGKKLHYIGHSGGGFTDEELSSLEKILSRIKVSAPPISEKVPVNSPITWVKPKYVCQVKFSEWTPEGRMRHPVYAGLRDDKQPEEVVREYPQTASATLTHSEKILWPRERYTKQDLWDYYDRIAGYILPYLKDRPQNMLRHPQGLKSAGFFQKDVNFRVPDFVRLEKIWSEHNRAEINYLLCQNKDTLLYMVNLACIEINPWNSRVDGLDRPDYMIIDLDPGKNTFREVVRVARVMHEILMGACEENYIKTSGKTGLHIYIPLAAKYTYDQVRLFARLLVELAHRRLPELTSLERSPAKRKNKIYLDYLQNSRGQTIAAPYSLRPYPGATVSTPLEWSEVKAGLDPAKFNIKTIFKRLEKKGDLWKPLLHKAVDLEKSLRYLENKFSLDSEKLFKR